MARIPLDRTGYAGYSCIGISRYAIGPIDCAAAGYKRLPPSSEGSLSNHAWEDLSSVESSPERTALGALCNVDYDPFTGAFMDLYSIFAAHSPGTVADSCFEASERYPDGFIGPISDLSANPAGDNCCGL